MARIASNLKQNWLTLETLKSPIVRSGARPCNLGVVPLILVQACYGNSQLSGTTI